MDMIHIWTDGSSKGNPGPGGAGIVIVRPDGTIERKAAPLGYTTNNRAELIAVRLALEHLADSRHATITIHTDSQGVIGWLSGAWRCNANYDLVTEIRLAMRKFKSVSFVKVQGHSGDQHNEAADALATYAAIVGAIDIIDGVATVS